MRLHHRIALALEEAGPRLAPSPAELAHHFLASRHLDREGKAVGYCVQAAEQATESLAYEDAVAAYRSALGAMTDLCLTDECRRCALLLALGAAEARAGDPAARDTFALAAEIAATEGLPEQLAEAALGRATNVHQAGTIDREGIELLDAALVALGEQESALHRAAAGATGEPAALRGRVGSRPRAQRASGRDGAADRRPGSRSSRRWRAATPRSCTPTSTSGCGSARSCWRSRARIGERELECSHCTGAPSTCSSRAPRTRPASTRWLLARLADELRQPTYRYFSLRWDSLWAHIDDRLEDAARLIERGSRRSASAPSTPMSMCRRWAHASGSPTASGCSAPSRR